MKVKKLQMWNLVIKIIQSIYVAIFNRNKNEVFMREKNTQQDIVYVQ